MYSCGWKKTNPKKKDKEKKSDYPNIPLFSTSSGFLQVGQGELGGGVEAPERESLSKNQKEITIQTSPYSWLAQSWIFPLVPEAPATAQSLWQGTQSNRPNI